MRIITFPHFFAKYSFLFCSFLRLFLFLLLFFGLHQLVVLLSITVLIFPPLLFLFLFSLYVILLFSPLPYLSSFHTPFHFFFLLFIFILLLPLSPLFFFFFFIRTNSLSSYSSATFYPFSLVISFLRPPFLFLFLLLDPFLPLLSVFSLLACLSLYPFCSCLGDHPPLRPASLQLPLFPT